MYQVNGNGVAETFTDWLAARARAKQLANEHRGESFYLGSVGCDPRDQERWCYDRDERRAINWACND